MENTKAFFTLIFIMLGISTVSIANLYFWLWFFDSHMGYAFFSAMGTFLLFYLSVCVYRDIKNKWNKKI